MYSKKQVCWAGLEESVWSRVKGCLALHRLRRRPQVDFTRVKLLQEQKESKGWNSGQKSGS